MLSINTKFMCALRLEYVRCLSPVYSYGLYITSKKANRESLNAFQYFVQGCEIQVILARIGRMPYIRKLRNSFHIFHSRTHEKTYANPYPYLRSGLYKIFRIYGLANNEPLLQTSVQTADKS